MNKDQRSFGGAQSTQARILGSAVIALLIAACPSALPQDLMFTAAPEAAWTSVVCSRDGTICAAYAPQVFIAGIPALLYVSTDSGATWRTANPGPIRPYSLALTPDASTLVGVCPGVSYASHDLGLTWKTNALPGPNAQRVALSDDGMKWVCSDTTLGYAAVPGAIYISDDSGASWQPTSAPITNWTWVVCSAEGSHLAAVLGNGQVFISSDRGLTWQTRVPANPTNAFNLVVCSADGNKLVAMGDLFCVSTNGGADWIQVGTRPPPGPNHSGSYVASLSMVSASADASSLAATRAGDSLIWTSTNSGAGWTFHAGLYSAGSFSGVASSAEGNRLFAAGSMLLYTWPPPPVALAFGFQGTNFVLSWPSNQLGFSLEATTSLAPNPTWNPVTNEVSMGAYRFNVTPSPGTASAYYRLRKP